jgi:4-amino-4-deoxy-L-arabinose transferase-like glycosyltransferase
MTPAPEESPRFTRSDLLAAGLILLIALVPRLLFLGADPPQDMQQAFIYDEGLWSHNARNRVLFGQWILDDHNPPLFMTPLYSLVLAAVYQIAGVSLTSTRLLAALGGSLSCVVVFGLLRAWYPLRQAIVAPLLLALSYFMLSYNRVAFTESFQLLPLTAAAAATVLATRRAGWGWIAGVCFVLTQLAKPSGAALGLAIVGFWAAHWWLSRQGRIEPAFSWRGPVRFVVAALATSAVVVLAMIPEWNGVMHQVGVSLRMAFSGVETNSEEWQRYTLFGWNGFGLVRGAMVAQTVVPLLAVLLLLVARLGRATARPLDLVELFAWCWLLLGLLFIGFERYQPDRRFLFLLPAIAILAAPAFSDGGVRLPCREGFAGAGAKWRTMLAGALLGGGLLYLLAPLFLVRVGGLRPASMLISLGAALGAVLLTIVATRLPRRTRQIPALLFLAGFLLLEPLRFGWFLSHPAWSVRDASQVLGTMTTGLPADDRTVFGAVANTLSLGTELFPLVMRDNPRTGARMNLDGWERFHPAVGLTVAGVAGNFLRREIEGHQLVRCRSLLLWPGPAGPRLEIEVYLRPDLMGRCGEAVGR